MVMIHLGNPKSPLEYNRADPNPLETRISKTVKVEVSPKQDTAKRSAAESLTGR